MVDCDYFTQFNRSLIVESNRVILDYKNCDYSIEIPFPNQECRRIEKSNSSNFIKKTPIKAVYGIIQMQINKYLVVVTKATVIGQVYHRKIYQLHKVEFVCLNQKEQSSDKTYIAGMQQILQNKYFYFSDDYDLTNSLQSFINSNCSMKNKRLQYMYNGIWIDEFIKIKAYQWITGFISGFITISFTHAGVNNACELALITRRDKRRQGMRWLTRGTDLDGNTANTAETQIVFLTQANGKQQIFSYVQLRGSMPFLWKQTPNLKWAPSCTINPNDRLNSQMTKKNYDDISNHYENCTLINLIDKKGTQKRMGEYFDKMHNTIGQSNFNLIWFDFHAQCKNMKYENLARLLDMISKQIQNYGYFHMETYNAGTTQRRVSKKNSQKGIFRTNCMDCLDRTNVVQSVLGRQILLVWLVKLGIHHKNRGITAFEKLSSDNLEQIFRCQWTFNADSVSILYSGTPALKTDFTATGKRTFKGSLKDGQSSVKRFFLGNFYDNKKQDFIDFSLGQIQPAKNKKQKIKHSSVNSLFVILALTIAIPFLVGWQVNQNTDQESPRFLMKLGISLLAVLFFWKGCQVVKSGVLRSPIRSGNY